MFEDEYDSVQVSDTLNRLYGNLTIRSDATFYKESCYISHRDTLYFYGGAKSPKRISKIECDQSKTSERHLKFDFIDGACASNNQFILLCFPIENNRLCYKSKSPVPNKWWEWFTYVEFSYATHNAFALSSGN